MPEGAFDIGVAAYEGEHYVASVRVHASASAFPAEEFDSLLFAICNIDFRFHHLIPSENDGRADLPMEEGFATVPVPEYFIEMGGHIFFHRKIEYQSAFSFSTG